MSWVVVRLRHGFGQAHAALQVNAELRPRPWVHTERVEETVGGVGRLLEVLDRRLDVARLLVEVAELDRAPLPRLDRAERMRRFCLMQSAVVIYRR
jgi:hypothetical protein